MPNLKWLIQRGSGADEPNAGRFVEIARAAGHDVIEAKYVPMGGGIEAYSPTSPIDIKDDDKVVAICTINLYRFLHRTTNWMLGWANFDDLRCHVYYDQLGKYLIHPQYIMLPFREIMRKRDWIYTLLGGDRQEVFIRPDDNAKSFNGEVVSKENLNEWYEYVKYWNGEYYHSPCVIASTVPILQEWRIVVADKKVIDGSQYRLNGSVEWKAGYDSGSAEFAEKIAAEYELHPIFCLDIAKTPDGYKLVEVSSVNTAGLYMCKIEPIVNAITIIAQRDQ